MEKDPKAKHAEISHPLFKFAIPLALSLAGIIISTLTRRSAARKKPSQEQHQMDYPESMSQYEFEDEESPSDEEKEATEEEEEDDDDDVENQDGDAEVEEKPRSAHLSESREEISIEQCHEVSDSDEQVEGLRYLVASVEDRQSLLEQQFYDYCNMKEQESAFQKLQIMCLGLKLELLESQNQKVEDTIAEYRGAMEQADLMRAEIKLLQRKANKLTKANREQSNLFKHYASKLKAREEASRSNEEFHRTTKEIKEVTSRLHEEIKVIEEKFEIRSSKLPMEEGLAEDMTRLQQLRDKWAAEMEELIYLGWINACLRREILITQEDEEEDGAEDEDDGDHVEEETKVRPDSRDEVIMEFPDDGHVRNCSVEFYDMNCPSKVTDSEDACVSVAAKSPIRSSKKPRLLRKLKGWATGKGKCKRASGSKGKSLEAWHCSSP